MSKSNKKPTKMKTKAPAKLVVKKEPISQNKESLCHLVDDRVELIRQIFQTLKSKTIKSIAPDFLQDCSAESIQEYCLDELLGISNKRLLSIIQATKCPTDTEDSDSDVENIEEHISLEEISSDSEDHKKKKKPTKQSPNGATKEANKPMSMLELLELQARARAIRSQLALEPVTKIELDSDTETTRAPTTSSNAAKPKEVASPKPTPPAPAPVVPEPRPIRLKRNFRQRQNADYEPSEDENTPAGNASSATVAAATPEKEPAVAQVAEPSTVAKTTTTNDSITENGTVSAETVTTQTETVPVPTETVPEQTETAPANSRSPSPDLVPIISSPPTFCISSDDSENEDQQFLQKIQKAGNYINMPQVTITRPVTEDELFLRTVKQSAAPQTKSIFVDAAPIVKENPQPVLQTAPVDVEESEAEEGEISDEEVEAPVSTKEYETVVIADDETQMDVDAVAEPNPNTSKTTESSSSSGSSSDGSDVEEVGTAIKTEVLELNYRTDDIVDIHDDDEDIIDLGKDEVLDFDVDPKEDATKNEDEETVNWGDRWLRCKKVSKVMATARLANKVRSKIKKNKKDVALEAEAALQNVTTDAVTVPEPTPAADPSIVEGSVEQYALIGGEVSDQLKSTE